MTWSGFIHAAASSQHAVHVYDELGDLAESVAGFVDAGLRTGAPAVVIAIPDHWRRFTHELDGRGWNVSDLTRRGVVIYRDAEETLAAFMDGELPSPERFERVVGGLVDEIAARFPNETTRAFGEMVDILLRDGCERAAIALEELWDELAQTRRFALLCGYRLDIFDHEVQKQALPDVFRTHTHVRTSAENATLSAALDKALGDLVDPIEVARIYLHVAEQVPGERCLTPRRYWAGSARPTRRMSRRSSSARVTTTRGCSGLRPPEREGPPCGGLSAITLLDERYPRALECEVAVHDAPVGDANTARTATSTPQMFAAAEIGTWIVVFVRATLTRPVCVVGPAPPTVSGTVAPELLVASQVVGSIAISLASAATLTSQTFASTLTGI